MELANNNLSYVKLLQYIVTFDKNSVFSTAKITVRYTLGLLRSVKGTNWSVFNILTNSQRKTFIFRSSDMQHELRRTKPGGKAMSNGTNSCVQKNSEHY